jgi:predicted RNA-binding protein YlqC (UPF0109 family)
VVSESNTKMQGRILLQRDVVGDLVFRMIRAVVDSPGAVKVDATTESGLTVYRATVSGGEVGQVIGKQGRTAQALRTILAAIAMKEKRRIELDIATSSDRLPAMSLREVQHNGQPPGVPKSTLPTPS